METTEEHTKKEPKPPPIFVTGVENINPLTSLLHTEIAGKYSNKASVDQVKIQVEDGISYSKITKALNERNTHYHTYRTKDTKTFRVVLKNIHPSTNTEDIKQT
jgi:hypothetical protein